MRALRGISYALPVLAVLWMAGTSVLWASDECPARPVAVRGDSLSPLLLDGMRVMMKPASCAGAVRRNDLVIFRTGALKQPVIKIARGLPGRGIVSRLMLTALLSSMMLFFGTARALPISCPYCNERCCVVIRRPIAALYRQIPIFCWVMVHKA